MIKRLVEILKTIRERCEIKMKEKSFCSSLLFSHEKRDYFQFPIPHVKREIIFFNFPSRMWEGKRFFSHFYSQRSPWILIFKIWRMWALSKAQSIQTVLTFAILIRLWILLILSIKNVVFCLIWTFYVIKISDTRGAMLLLFFNQCVVDLNLL